MIKGARWRFSLSIGLAVGLLTGCSATDGGDGGGGDSPTDAADAADNAEAVDDGSGEPQSGGTLQYVMFSEAESLDATALSTTALSNLGMRGYAIYDMLVKQDNKTGDLDFGTAESISSEDNSTWTIVLREGIEFSDGTPYDAEAVRFNFERHADPETGSRSIGEASAIESMQVVDELTLDVVLAEPQAQWPTRLASSSLNFVGSPTAIEQLGEGFGQSPVGAGPFVVREWRRDDRLILDRNDNYWNSPLPYLDGVEMRVIPDNGQRYSTLATGDAHLMSSNSYENIERAAQDGFTVDETIVNGGRVLGMNNTRPPFDDDRVRRAMRVGIDFDALNEVRYEGLGNLAGSLFQPEHPFYEPEADYPGFDPEQAQSLLDEYAVEAGAPAAFAITAIEADRSMVEYIQEILSGYGVDMRIDFVTAPEVREALVTREFDMVTTTLSFIDPVPMLHQQVATGGDRNFSQYSNPEVDALIEELELTQEEDARAELYGELQLILADDINEVVWVRIAGYHFADDSVQGATYIEDGFPRLELLWLDEA